MNNIIKANKVSCNYGKGDVLKDVSFTVNKGDFISIIGSNGSGKSTLLKLILGQLTPNGGEIMLFGTPIQKFNEWTRLGYVPQNTSCFNGFPATALEIVCANLFSQIGLMRFTRSCHKEKARMALANAGIAEYADKQVDTLSGGQQQRVMIARALVNEPEILLLDEPVSSVDSSSADALYEYLCEINSSNKITIIMVTHDTGSVLKYADRIFCAEEASLMELEKKQLEEEYNSRHKHPHRKDGRNNG